MGQTSIEWTDFSINPIRARDIRTGAVGHYCEKVSPGCAHCYSSKFQPRFHMPTFGGRRKHPADPVVSKDGARIVGGGLEVFLDEQRLLEVLKRRKPTTYFWCDMTDLFGEWVPFEWIDRCFAVMALTPHHTHQVLTKRPERMAEYLASNGYASARGGPMRDRVEVQAMKLAVLHNVRDPGGYPPPPACRPECWPLPNLWLGTSCENQQTADERIPHLLQCPAAVRFLSCEPLLSGVDLIEPMRRFMDDACLKSQICPPPKPLARDEVVRLMRTLLHLVIVGGESGPGARPMHPSWARSLRDQCQAAGVAYFFKQWGEWSPKWAWARGVFVDPDTGKVDDPHKRMGPKGLPVQNDNTMFRVGKKAAGRELDGRTWDELPEPPEEVEQRD